MKKQDLAKLAMGVMSMPALMASVAGVVISVSSDQAHALVGCVAGTSNVAVSCSGAVDASGYIARDLTFSGSVGVVIFTSENTTGFGACGGHVQGSGNQYGLTTVGGSVEIVTGAPGVVPTAANITGGGC